MIIDTQGIVISAIKYRDTSLIAKIYTRSHGLVSFILKGVRSSKAKNKAALFQPLTILDLVMLYRDSKNLQHLREYKHGYIYQSLPFDVVKSSISLFLLEVLNQCVQEEEQNEYLFDFLEQSFQNLDKQEGIQADFHLRFLLQLLPYIGLEPQGKVSEETPVFDLQEATFKKVAQHDFFVTGIEASYFSALLHQESFSANKSLRKSVLQQILTYYRLHLDSFRPIKSLAVLETVFG